LSEAFARTCWPTVEADVLVGDQSGVIGLVARELE